MTTKWRFQHSTRGSARSIVSFSKLLVSPIKSPRMSFLKSWTNTTRFLSILMQSLKSTLMNLKTFPNYKDFWTRTREKSSKTFPTLLKRIFVLTTISRIVSIQECHQEFILSSGTKSMLTFSKCTTKSSRRDLCRWNLKSLSTPDQLPQRMEASTSLVAATREETSTLRSATDTMKFSETSMRRQAWFSLTQIIHSVQLKASFMWLEPLSTVKFMAFVRFMTSRKTNGSKLIVSE